MKDHQLDFLYELCGHLCLLQPSEIWNNKTYLKRQTDECFEVKRHVNKPYVNFLTVHRSSKSFLDAKRFGPNQNQGSRTAVVTIDLCLKVGFN